MGNPKYTELDGQGWFERADHFFFSAGLLATQPQEMQFIYARPHIVIKAFATEAYLKSLLCVEVTEFEKTHDLLGLFDLLSLESKKMIEKWWNKESKPILDRTRKSVPRDKYKAPKSLRGALNESSSAFLDWRYHGKIAYIGFSILGFPSNVRRRILQLKPEWKPVAHSPLNALDPKAEFVEREDYGFDTVAVGAAILKPKPPSFKASLAAWRGPYPKNGRTR